jgi:hypothetical protein
MKTMPRASTCVPERHVVAVTSSPRRARPQDREIDAAKLTMRPSAAAFMVSS